MCPTIEELRISHQYSVTGFLGLEVGLVIAEFLFEDFLDLAVEFPLDLHFLELLLFFFVRQRDRFFFLFI